MVRAGSWAESAIAELDSFSVAILRFCLGRNMSQLLLCVEQLSLNYQKEVVFS